MISYTNWWKLRLYVERHNNLPSRRCGHNLGLERYGLCTQKKGASTYCWQVVTYFDVLILKSICEQAK